MIAVQTSPNAASSVSWPFAQRSNIAADTGCADGKRQVTRSDEKDEKPASSAGIASGTMIRRSEVDGVLAGHILLTEKPHDGMQVNRARHRLGV